MLRLPPSYEYLLHPDQCFAYWCQTLIIVKCLRTGEPCSYQDTLKTRNSGSGGLDEAWLTQKPDGIFSGANKACPFMYDSVQWEGLQELVEAALLVHKGRQQAAVVFNLTDELHFTHRFSHPFVLRTEQWYKAPRHCSDIMTTRGVSCLNQPRMHEPRNLYSNPAINCNVGEQRRPFAPAR